MNSPSSHDSNMHETQAGAEVPTPRTLAVRPLSWAESITDDRPVYISHQIPVSRRPRLEPRDAVVPKNDTLHELAQFFKDNPTPPKHPRILLPAPEINKRLSNSARFVKRASRKSQRSSSSIPSLASSSRDSSVSLHPAIKKSDTSTHRHSGSSNHSEAIRARTSLPPTPKSTSVPTQFPNAIIHTKELDAYISRWNDRVRSTASEPSLILDPVDEEVPMKLPDLNAPDTTVMSTVAKNQAFGKTKPPPPLLIAPQASSRPASWTGIPPGSPLQPPSPAPRKPLPPLPTNLTSEQKSMLGNEATESIVPKPAETNRAMSLRSSHSSKLRSVATSGSLRGSFREESTRARKLKHLHGESRTRVAVAKETGATVNAALLNDHQIDHTNDPSSTSNANPDVTDTSTSAKVVGDASVDKESLAFERSQPENVESQVLAERPVTNSTGPDPLSDRKSHHSSTLESLTRSQDPIIGQPNGRHVESEETRYQPESLKTFHDNGAKNQRNNSASTQHLSDRIAYLERENKLLEAALMAVLKTGGSFMKCPCGGMGFEQALHLASRQGLIGESVEKSAGLESLTTSGLSRKSPDHISSAYETAYETPPTSASFFDKFRRGEEAERPQTRERRWSCGTEDSLSWNLASKSARNSVARSSLSSALALYTQTRPHLPLDGSRSKAYST